MLTNSEYEKKPFCSHLFPGTIAPDRFNPTSLGFWLSLLQFDIGGSTYVMFFQARARVED